jgi:hypothetical protein
MNEYVALYNISKTKEKFINDFYNEVVSKCLDIKQGCYARKGFTYLNFIRYKDLNDWDVRSGTISEAVNQLFQKVKYMLYCGHSNFTDVINMLRRIVIKGTKGCFKGRGERLEWYLDDMDSDLSYQDFIRKKTIGHFHFNHGGVYTLKEEEILLIEKFLRKYELL